MKNVKMLCFLFFAVMSTANVFAQSEWMKVHADQRVEAINKEIISVDEDAALDVNQKKELHTLLIENFKAIRTIKKGTHSDAEKTKLITEKRKELWSKIHQDIFTKEQRVARKTAKENE